MKYVVRAAVAAVALAGVSSAQANLVTNGDFATDAAGWTYNNLGVDGGYLAGEGNPPGSFWINHNGGNVGPDPDPMLSQAIATVAGLQYDLTFDYSGRVIAGGLGLAVDIAGVQSATFSILDNAWRSGSLSFVASGPSTQLAFRSEINGSDFDARIDNVVLLRHAIVLPEPGTLGILTLAFLGVGVAASRRGRGTARSA